MCCDVRSVPAAVVEVRMDGASREAPGGSANNSQSDGLLAQVQGVPRHSH